MPRLSPALDGTDSRHRSRPSPSGTHVATPTSRVYPGPRCPRPRPRRLGRDVPLMIAAGCNAKALSVVMGHVFITITFDRYGHLMPGTEPEVGRLLGTSVGDNPLREPPQPTRRPERSQAVRPERSRPSRTLANVPPAWRARSTDKTAGAVGSLWRRCMRSLPKRKGSCTRPSRMLLGVRSSQTPTSLIRRRTSRQLPFTSSCKRRAATLPLSWLACRSRSTPIARTLARTLLRPHSGSGSGRRTGWRTKPPS